MVGKGQELAVAGTVIVADTSESDSGATVTLPVMLVATADAPSLALTGISRDTLGHIGKLAIHRVSDTARLRSSANAERDSLERSAARSNAHFADPQGVSQRDSLR
jgi:hypothetical protein